MIGSTCRCLRHTDAASWHRFQPWLQFVLPLPLDIAMPRSLLAIILGLLVLHQDNWFWTDGRLVFGFMPVGLFYQACISIAASCAWLYAVKKCWPSSTDVEGTEGGPS